MSLVTVSGTAAHAQAFVALHQQVLTPLSALPLEITHPSIVLLQHYHQASPNLEEIFNAWREGDKARDDKLIEAAVGLLAHIIQLLTPLPFFRTAVLNWTAKLTAFNEPYPELVSEPLL